MTSHCARHQQRSRRRTREQKTHEDVEPQASYNILFVVVGAGDDGGGGVVDCVARAWLTWFIFASIFFESHLIQCSFSFEINAMRCTYTILYSVYSIHNQHHCMPQSTAHRKWHDAKLRRIYYYYNNTRHKFVRRYNYTFSLSSLALSLLSRQTLISLLLPLLLTVVFFRLLLFMYFLSINLDVAVSVIISSAHSPQSS